jgi:hypothetical protein
MKNSQKNKIMLLATFILLAIAAFTGIQAKESEATDSGKTVAWYVANLKEAKAQNQQCHDNPNLQSTPACINSLHALQISFVGGN